MSRRSLYKPGRHHTVPYGHDAANLPINHYSLENVELSVAGDDGSGLSKFNVRTWVQIPEKQWSEPASDGVKGDILALPTITYVREPSAAPSAEAPQPSPGVAGSVEPTGSAEPAAPVESTDRPSVKAEEVKTEIEPPTEPQSVEGVEPSPSAETNDHSAPSAAAEEDVQDEEMPDAT